MHIAHKRTSTQGTSETDAEYFDYNADLSNTHLQYQEVCRGGRPCPPDFTAEYFDYHAGLTNLYL